MHFKTISCSPLALALAHGGQALAPLSSELDAEELRAIRKALETGAIKMACHGVAVASRLSRNGSSDSDHRFPLGREWLLLDFFGLTMFQGMTKQPSGWADSFNLITPDGR